MEFKPRIVKLEVSVENAHCRVMSGTERDNWLKVWRIYSNKEADVRAIGELYSYLIAKCLCEKDGALAFTDPKTANDMIDAVTQEELFVALLRANGFGKEAKEDAKKN